MSRVLYFGRLSRPKAVVVMLHGLNDSAASCAKGVAQRWALGLRDVLVAVPQSPDRSLWNEDSTDPGYDWLRQRGTQNTDDWGANVRELQRVTRARLRQVDRWLDRLLARYCLTNRQLILAGFSQGAVLAALSGARRLAFGVVLCGGVPGQPVYSREAGDYVGGGWMDWEQLLPKGAKSRQCPTKFCVVNGTEDVCVPRQPNEAMLARFDTTWHWDKGVGHDFPNHWYTVALRWMRRVLEEVGR
mmetsp:Transcript_125643/g.349918  ORF Transcript_125643/g.349918 Transcript_125643/m.349918 type:complete len:244 (+) Transcript_125643:3-734(+)